MQKVFATFLLFATLLSTLTMINTASTCHPPPPPPCIDASFLYVGRDLTTQGDWIEHGYGDCGYALPYAEVKKKEVAIGETTGIGESAHRFWWREPWSIEGPTSYAYSDYLGGAFIPEYNVSGPEGPPRALVDADSMYYRPSWYSHGFSITLTLSGIVGDFNLSVYLLDWDYGMRTVQVNVTSGGEWDAVNLGWFVNGMSDNFAAGTYAIFEVHSDGVIEIEVLNLKPGHPEWSAVIAGIFLDELSSPVTGVNFLEVDRETKGNWRPSYGNDYYLLPGFNVLTSGVCYTPINKAYDETNIPLGNYDVSDGVCQFAADDARTYGEYPYIGQYAAYEWTLPFDKTASDPRVLVYPEDKIYYGYPPTPLNGRIYGQWDSGELGWPLDHFVMRLKIPEGRYVLSVYAMDFGRAGRSENITVWDESMTTLLDSQHITADEINNGIYVQWFVKGPKIINIKVIADRGNLNSFLDGIFLNCVSCRCGYCGKTIGFWMCNVWKAFFGWENGVQVSKEDILSALDTITELYGTGSTWDFDWLTFEGTDDEKLIQAFSTLWYSWYADSMQAKAQAQILALLLTDTHYGKHFCIVQIEWYEGGQARTITGWITIILNEYGTGNYETAKDLADYLNNAHS